MRGQAWQICAGLFLSLVLGVLVLLNPTAAAAMTLAAAALTVALHSPETTYKLYSKCLGLLLIGYACLGRGFAYLNIGGVYVGEIVLALGIVTLIVVTPTFRALFTRPYLFILLFMSWGAIRTVPYLGTYGLDAARDGVIYGYALFAFIVAGLASRESFVPAVVSRYRRVLPVLMFSIPIAVFVTRALLDRLPRVPGTDVSFILLKMGDAAVHLSGLGAFVLLGLARSNDGEPEQASGKREWPLWIPWGVGVVAVANSRSALLTLALALFAAVGLGKRIRWQKPLVVFSALLLTMLVLNVEIDLDGVRKVSLEHIVQGAASIVQDEGPEYLEGSRRWRLAWWSEILDYTLWGDYFWLGKGFGVNLTIDDGLAADPDDPLRSPHNGHLTVLARAGMPGAVLWITLQFGYALSLLRAWRQARRASDVWWRQLFAWLIVYWLAFVTNASFDVYLEGPQGGIWFWCMIGFGIVATKEYRAQHPERLPGHAMPLFS
jgi:hypothetical protein